MVASVNAICDAQGDHNIPQCYGGSNTREFPQTEIWAGDLKHAREGETAVVVPAGQSRDFCLDIAGAATVTWGLRVWDYNVVYEVRRRVCPVFVLCVLSLS